MSYDMGPLRRALETEREAHETLCNLIDEQRAMLLEGAFDGFDENVSGIRALRCRMKPMAKERDRQAKAAALALGASEISVRAIVERLPEPDSRSLESLRAAYADTLKRLHRASDLCQTLLDARVAANQRNLEYIAGTRMDAGNNYTAHGQTASGFERYSMLDTQI